MSAIALVEDYLKGRNDPLKAVKESLDHCERDRNGSFLNLDRKGAIAAAELSQKRYSQGNPIGCLLYTSPSPRDATLSRMPSSA